MSITFFNFLLCNVFDLSKNIVQCSKGRLIDLKSIIFLSATICSFYVLRLAVAIEVVVGLYLWMALFFCYANYIIKDRNKIAFSVEVTIFYILIYSIYLIAAYSTDESYSIVKMDISNATKILLLIPVLTSLRRRDLLDDFKLSFAKTNVLILTPIAIYSLYKFYMLVNGVFLTILIYEDELVGYPKGTALLSDQNMSAYAMIIGMVSGAYWYTNEENATKRNLILLMMVPMLLSGLFSGSRRMIIVVMITIVVALSLPAYAQFRKIIKLKRFHLNIGLLKKYISIISLSFISVCICINFLVQIGIEGISSHHFRNILSRYESLITFYETLQQSRGTHFQLGMNLLNSFTTSQLVIGDGFRYISIIGAQIGEYSEDYPHNMLLSGILHGGIFNCFIIILFLYRALLLYYQNRKKCYFFFILYLYSLLMLLISSNSIFSVSVLLLLLVLPYVESNRGSIVL